MDCFFSSCQVTLGSFKEKHRFFKNRCNQGQPIYIYCANIMSENSKYPTQQELFLGFVQQKKRCLKRYVNNMHCRCDTVLCFQHEYCISKNLPTSAAVLTPSLCYGHCCRTAKTIVFTKMWSIPGTNYI